MFDAGLEDESPERLRSRLADVYGQERSRHLAGHAGRTHRIAWVADQLARASHVAIWTRTRCYAAGLFSGKISLKWQDPAADLSTGAVVGAIAGCEIAGAYGPARRWSGVGIDK